ncbi:methionine aminopeptidase type I [Actinomadura hallensis]|uniref:Methionine aminopeptidase n=1 Tax=Actinomadura hallensis TaxID=337895 RepID=A0A543IME3_9ACTN|nr:type I methionyl aminopeptidase [Actinomadura hallensis]TQM71709.1 methionine aminopeptidase type I [Actinomadura hallensis]HLV71891.1 type I methionyl aminopeptidase [Vulgatibacteraceae bacterium]
MVTYRSPREWERMRDAGRVVARILRDVRAAAEPGVPLAELDAVAARTLKEHGATSPFLHYKPSWAPMPYPANICVSVNEVVVHGIPKGVLKDGDLVTVDGGARLAGYCGDAAVSFIVGTPDEAGLRLVETTRTALERAIAAAVPGNRMGDVTAAIESTARRAGYGIADGSGGHGIGTEMHEDPPVPNKGLRRGMRLREGLTIAIEPLVTESGRDETRVLGDGWSVVTADGSRAAHFEHSIAITEDGPLVLTAL